MLGAAAVTVQCGRQGAGCNPAKTLAFILLLCYNNLIVSSHYDGAASFPDVALFIVKGEVYKISFLYPRSILFDNPFGHQADSYNFQCCHLPTQPSYI